MPTATRKPGPKPGPKRVQVTTTLKPETRTALKKLNSSIGKAIDGLADGSLARRHGKAAK